MSPSEQAQQHSELQQARAELRMAQEELARLKAENPPRVQRDLSAAARRLAIRGQIREFYEWASVELGETFEGMCAQNRNQPLARRRLRMLAAARKAVSGAGVVDLCKILGDRYHGMSSWAEKHADPEKVKALVQKWKRKKFLERRDQTPPR